MQRTTSTAVGPTTANAALIRLLHLASPALPVGAYSYSQGLEQAVHRGWVHDEKSAQHWILSIVRSSLATLDAPIYLRLHDAWCRTDSKSVRYWNDLLFASRGTHELQQEERTMGRSFARVLETLSLSDAGAWIRDPRTTYANMFSLASATWGIAREHAACALLFAWVENQVSAAIRLVPLGQSAGQRICAASWELIPQLLEQAAELDDASIGASCPAQTIASTMHETLYSRIFRS